MEDTYDLKTYKEEYRRVLDLAESKPLEKTAEALDLYYDSAAVAYLWQRRVCVSRKTSGR